MAVTYIWVLSIQIPSTVQCFATAPVSEAECAALFANAQVGCDERVILSCLGYPQPPTPIFCDNECAIGLATETFRPKKSKSIDMRFDWLRCRVRQNLFSISWISGDRQLADFFTKALPVNAHVALAPVHCAPPGSTPLSLAPVVPSVASRSATALSASLTWPCLSDAGATHILLRRSSLPAVRHLFSPKSLPSIFFLSFFSFSKGISVLKIIQIHVSIGKRVRV
jgi:hypothetical protein